MFPLSKSTTSWSEQVGEPRHATDLSHHPRRPFQSVSKRVGCFVVCHTCFARTASANAGTVAIGGPRCAATGPANAGTASCISSSTGHDFVGSLLFPLTSKVASARQDAANPQGRYGPAPGERPSVPGTQTVPRPRLRGRWTLCCLVGIH